RNHTTMHPMRILLSRDYRTWSSLKCRVLPGGNPMRKSLSLWCGCLVNCWVALVLAPVLFAAPSEATARTGRYSRPTATEKTPEKDGKPPKTITDIVKSNKKFDGLFTLYQDTTNGTVHLLIKQAQLDNEVIYFTHPRDGVLAAG